MNQPAFSFDPGSAFSLQGQTAIVTGGAKGIGRAIARGMAKSGAFVALFDRDFDAARIEKAVDAVLSQGLRTPDIYSEGTTRVGTREMGDAVVKALA